MSRFFINHPIFAWVIAILIALGGLLAINGLGVESYPNIAPPQVTVAANYPGASAEEDTRRMNAFIEERVREMPEQYLWTHRRFKTRPGGEAGYY